MAYRELLPREFRTAEETSPPFYTSAQKLHFHVVIESGGAIEWHLEEGWPQPDGDLRWHELHESTLPMDSPGNWSVICHNQLLPAVEYDELTERVRLWFASDLPLRVRMVMEGVSSIYSVAVAEGISTIEGPDS